MLKYCDFANVQEWVKMMKFEYFLTLLLKVNELTTLTPPTNLS